MIRAWIVQALAAAGILLAFEACASPGTRGAAGFQRASRMPDLSGLAWIEGDLFLAVHDAKLSDEADLPRVSLLRLPTGLDGILWEPLPVVFPGEKSSDLESAARIPGEAGGRVRVLLAESTEEQAEKPFSRRIFVAEVDGERVEIVDHVLWPVSTKNVEATAVAEIGGALLFLFAERAEGEGSSEIRFAEMTLEPLGFGAFESAGAFTSPGPTGPIARPVSALEIDAAGAIYAASAEDPDDDNGPFRSVVYRIGRVVVENGQGSVALDPEPTRLAVLDGFKVESLAVREEPGRLQRGQLLVPLSNPETSQLAGEEVGLSLDPVEIECAAASSDDGDSVGQIPIPRE
jgi:hypothetical protein